ncbi:MAG: TIGR00725 family protein [Candidatus Omnitrophica bacterium]|nr:TIGR00725 family protein [Candidatus Omnitrophota bacterium]
MNISVIGGSKCSVKTAKKAEELGQLIAENKWILICGGGSGVMEAACKGAYKAGGVTVGLLPEITDKYANKYLTVKIPMGIGYARNIFVVRASDYIIAVDGKTGTLSEIAFALNEGKKVYGIETWDIPGVIKVLSPQEAVERVKVDVK